jgi:hypothetical protein
MDKRTFRPHGAPLDLFRLIAMIVREKEALVVLVSMMLWPPECGRGFARLLQAVPCRHGSVLGPVLRSILISSPDVHLCKSHLGNEAILRYHQFGSLALNNRNSLLHTPDDWDLGIFVL